MSKKPAIPPVPSAGTDRTRFDVALKETVETLTGRRAEKIASLPADATLAQAVAKINEILDRLQ